MSRLPDGEEYEISIDEALSLLEKAASYAGSGDTSRADEEVMSIKVKLNRIKEIKAVAEQNKDEAIRLLKKYKDKVRAFDKQKRDIEAKVKKNSKLKLPHMNYKKLTQQFANNVKSAQDLLDQLQVFKSQELLKEQKKILEKIEREAKKF